MTPGGKPFDVFCRPLHLQPDIEIVAVNDPYPGDLPSLCEAFSQQTSGPQGVAKAPKTWVHRERPVLVPRFFALPEHPYPNLTAWSIRG